MTATPVVQLYGGRVHVGDRDDGFTLDVPQFEIRAGDRVAVVGPSGSGKSLFLELLGLIRAPDHADSFWLGLRSGERLDLRRMWRRRDPARMVGLRRSEIGFVLQSGGMLRSLTVRENILLPARLAGVSTDYATGLLDRLELYPLRHRRPDGLSVGQRQRVALARAMANRPTLLLADEPTAALDGANADIALDLLRDAASDAAAAVIIATHDRSRAVRMGFREIELHDVPGGAAMRVAH